MPPSLRFSMTRETVKDSQKEEIMGCSGCYYKKRHDGLPCPLDNCLAKTVNTFRRYCQTVDPQKLAEHIVFYNDYRFLKEWEKQGVNRYIVLLTLGEALENALKHKEGMEEMWYVNIVLEDIIYDFYKELFVFIPKSQSVDGAMEMIAPKLPLVGVSPLMKTKEGVVLQWASYVTHSDKGRVSIWITKKWVAGEDYHIPSYMKGGNYE